MADERRAGLAADAFALSAYGARRAAPTVLDAARGQSCRMTSTNSGKRAHAIGTTPDRAHSQEPAAAPLGTDEEAAGAAAARRPPRAAAKVAPESRNPAASAARWRQLGAALLLVLLIAAVFVVPVLLR